jgi:hypothetical protein
LPHCLYQPRRLRTGQTYETSLQYTITRFNPATKLSSFNANGGSGQFNFNRWFSGVVDAGAVPNGRVLDSTIVNYLAGPRLSQGFATFHRTFWLVECTLLRV